jgi:hypothetical protein
MRAKKLQPRNRSLPEGANGAKENHSVADMNDDKSARSTQTYIRR